MKIKKQLARKLALESSLGRSITFFIVALLLAEIGRAHV